MTFSYKTYALWNTVPPACSFFAIPFIPLLHICLGKTKNSKCIVQFSYYYSKIIFREALRMEKTNSETKIYLHQYELKSDVFYIFVFSTITTMALCFVFIAFWASFLIHQTFICSSTHDCFVTNSSLYDSVPSDFSPIKDCTDVESNATVVCFEFVFDLSGGFASAVGFLAATVVYVYLLGLLLACLSETNSRCLYITVSFVWLVFLSCIVLIFTILSSNVPLFRNVVHKTQENTLKWVSYVIGFTYIGILTNPLMLEIFKKIFCVNRCNSERSTKNELSDATPLHPHT